EQSIEAGYALCHRSAGRMPGRTRREQLPHPRVWILEDRMALRGDQSRGGPACRARLSGSEEVRCIGLRVVFAEYHRGKFKDVSIRVLPAVGVHTRLVASPFQILLQVPFLFPRNLGKKEALVVAILHQQAVLANLD